MCGVFGLRKARFAWNKWKESVCDSFHLQTEKITTDYIYPLERNELFFCENELTEMQERDRIALGKQCLNFGRFERVQRSVHQPNLLLAQHYQPVLMTTGKDFLKIVHFLLSIHNNQREWMH